MHPRTLALVLAVLAAACGDPDDDPPDQADAATSIDAGLPLDAAAGQIWIRANGVTGATGRIVVAMVLPSGGGPAQAAACVPVTADPFSFLAVAGPTGQGQPCAAGAPVMFADGTYEISAGLYTPGQQTPSRCARATVTVAGSGDVTLPAFAACP